MPDLSDNLVWKLIQDFFELLWYPIVFGLLPYLAFLIVKYFAVGFWEWITVDIPKFFRESSKRTIAGLVIFWLVFPFNFPVVGYLMGVRFLNFPTTDTILINIHKFLTFSGTVMIGCWSLLAVAVLLEQIFRFRFFEGRMKPKVKEEDIFEDEEEAQRHHNELFGMSVDDDEEDKQNSRKEPYLD